MTSPNHHSTQGRTLKDQRRIKIEVKRFFKELYRQKNGPIISFDDSLINKLTIEESTSLEAIPSIEEVKETVWSCETSKVPGFDGFNMNFIRKMWDIVGVEFTNIVLDFFITSKLEKALNMT